MKRDFTVLSKCNALKRKSQEKRNEAGKLENTSRKEKNLMRLFVVTWEIFYSREIFYHFCLCIFKKLFTCYKETFQHDFKFVLMEFLQLKDFENKMNFN